MKLFFDTSALLKHYLQEAGSAKADQLFEAATVIFVSSTAHLECASALQRLLNATYIDQEKKRRLREDLAIDFAFFQTVDFDDQLHEGCLGVIDKYPLKTLDAIQLASALMVIHEIDSFVVSDIQLKNYAAKEGFHIIDPTL